MIIDDIIKEKITLHGLGFVQVQLPEGQRIHVWHPELPRRHCFEHSSIHNHRFSFRSTVLVGEQINIPVDVLDPQGDASDYMLYLHEGARTAKGGRPWSPDRRVSLVESAPFTIVPGMSYMVEQYEFHRTRSGGDGKVATLLKKLSEGNDGAHSSCRVGVTPDADFDRFQWSPSRLWEIVSDVLAGPIAKPAPKPEKMAPVQGYQRGIPWAMHLDAYDAYCKKYGRQDALIDLEVRGCRGGFGTSELDVFIPGWREKLSERTTMLYRIAELERKLAESENALATMAKNSGASADPVVEANRALLNERSKVGIKKYGVTLGAGNLSEDELLMHTLQELLDGANYIQALMMRKGR